MSEPVLLGIDIGGTKTAVAAVTPRRHGHRAAQRPLGSRRRAGRRGRRAPRGRGGRLGRRPRTSQRRSAPACPGSSTRARVGPATPSTSVSSRSTWRDALSRALGLRRRGRERREGGCPRGRTTFGRAAGGSVPSPSARSCTRGHRRHRNPRRRRHTAGARPHGRGTGGSTPSPISTSGPDSQSADRCRDGVLVRGIDGAAGEIGHVPVGGDVLCTCGQVGCLETVASGTALARLWPPSRGRRDATRSMRPLAGDAAGRRRRRRAVRRRRPRDPAARARGGRRARRHRWRADRPRRRPSSRACAPTCAVAHDRRR